MDWLIPKTYRNGRETRATHLAAVLLLLMTIFSPCGVTAQSPQVDPLLTINKQFRKTYSQVRAAKLARTGPVIVVDGEKLVLLRGKEREESEIDLTRYHHLKLLAHVPLTVYLLLDTTDAGMIPEEQLAELRRLRESIVAACETLAERGFSAGQIERQRKLLADSLAASEEALKQQRCTEKERTAFARKMGPLVLANVAEAARVQIDGYHAQVSTWRRKLSAEEWGKLRVVIMGSQMPRKDNLAVQTFARLLGETGEGRRIIYAEALSDEKRALNLLGTHLLDREIAAAFFDDPVRMNRDLLGDATLEYLRTLKIDGPRQP
jgi:hypothetical protein